MIAIEPPVDVIVKPLLPVIPPLEYNMPVNVLVPVTCRLLDVIRLPAAVIVPEFVVLMFPLTSSFSLGLSLLIPTLPALSIVSLLPELSLTL